MSWRSRFVLISVDDFPISTFIPLTLKYTDLQVLQAIAVVRYFQLRLEGESKMDASNETAGIIYGKRFPSSFKARSIRHWADVYLVTSELVKFQQGLNAKTKSVITDENVQQIFKTELRAMKDVDRCPKSFKNILEERLLCTVPNGPKKLSLETARRWMIYLGFKSTKQGKGYYTDGHNRPDVTDHRVKFLAEMEVYEKRMIKYAGADMTEEESPVLSDGVRRIVFITHDESTFYCNEGKALLWMENGKKKILPKSKVALNVTDKFSSSSKELIIFICFMVNRGNR